MQKLFGYSGAVHGSRRRRRGCSDALEDIFEYQEELFWYQKEQLRVPGRAACVGRFISLTDWPQRSIHSYLKQVNTFHRSHNTSKMNNINTACVRACVRACAIMPSFGAQLDNNLSEPIRRFSFQFHKSLRLYGQRNWCENVKL